MLNSLKPLLFLSALLPAAPAAFAGPGDLPKSVARIAINQYLAERLVEECNDIQLNRNVAYRSLRKALAKEDAPSPLWNSFDGLQSELGDVFLLGAERVYFSQMKVYPFDRASACAAASKAINEKQDVGRFLSLK